MAWNCQYLQTFVAGFWKIGEGVKMATDSFHKYPVEDERSRHIIYDGVEHYEMLRLRNNIFNAFLELERDEPNLFAVRKCLSDANKQWKYLVHQGEFEGLNLEDPSTYPYSLEP